MHIVYLDQNKWIDLARAAARPAEYSELHELLNDLIDAVRSGKLALPLTFANIYETQKVNNAEQRRNLAYLQAAMSNGMVFRGRSKRLEEEISSLLRSACGLPHAQLDRHWFLSSNFIEAVADLGDARLNGTAPKNIVEFIRAQPAHCLYDYLVNTPDDVRVAAVRHYSNSSNQLRLKIEKRRALHRSEAMSERRKLYSVLLMVDEIQFMLNIARTLGLPWNSVSDMGDKTARRMIRDVPTYHVERELVLRLEAQDRPIEENDFRDMQSFCAVIPYADEVVAENQFANLAIQASLGKKYNTRIGTDIFGLRDIL